MLDGGIEDAVAGVAPVPTWAPGSPRGAGLDWKAVDRALRSIRRRRAALDAEEARWLRAAERLQIWRPLGMVSMLDYLERVLGYAPRTAQDRLRVARALGDLPQLTAALTAGELPFSAVRELTRVATPATEASWVAAAQDKTLRQIEELVADHRPGDRPEDPPAPEARMHVVRFELSAETFALLRQAHTVLDDEHGTHLPDDAFVAALCGTVLDGAPRGEPTGRAKFQVAITVCQRCRQGWQEGAGARIAIDATAVDRALCDAQHIGSIDGDGPERAHQDIPPSVARFVWRRDSGRCRVDGCRSSRGLELHHLIHRADGGSHDASNIVLVCSACHLAHHRGALTISGTANELQIRRPGEAAETGAQDDASESAGLPAYGAHVGAGPRSQGSVMEVDASLAACGVSPVTAPNAHVGAGLRSRGSMMQGDASVPAGAALTTDPGAHVGTEPRPQGSMVELAASLPACSVSPVAAPNAHVGAELRSRSSMMQGNASVPASGALTTDPGAHVGAGLRSRSSMMQGDASLAACGMSPATAPNAHVDTGPRSRSSMMHGDASVPAGGAPTTTDPAAHVGAMSSGRRVDSTSVHAKGARRLDAAILRAQAKAALTGLGWKPAIAHAAVATAAEAQGEDVTLERLIFESLRRCPTPKT